MVRGLSAARFIKKGSKAIALDPKGSMCWQRLGRVY